MPKVISEIGEVGMGMLKLACSNLGKCCLVCRIGKALSVVLHEEPFSVGIRLPVLPWCVLALAEVARGREGDHGLGIEVSPNDEGEADAGAGRGLQGCQQGGTAGIGDGCDADRTRLFRRSRAGCERLDRSPYRLRVLGAHVLRIQAGDFGDKDGNPRPGKGVGERDQTWIVPAILGRPGNENQSGFRVLARPVEITKNTTGRNAADGPALGVGRGGLEPTYTVSGRDIAQDLDRFDRPLWRTGCEKPEQKVDRSKTAMAPANRHRMVSFLSRFQRLNIGDEMLDIVRRQHVADLRHRRVQGREHDPAVDLLLRPIDGDGGKARRVFLERTASLDIVTSDA